MKKLNGKDLILLLLYSPGILDGTNEPIRGRTRIMKMIFLFKEEVLPKFNIDFDNLAEFIGWKFGPWSETVYSDLEFFQSIGFITVEPHQEDSNDLTPEEAEEFEKWEGDLSLSENPTDEYLQEVFKLTHLGTKFIDENNMYSSLTDNQKVGLRAFKKKFNSVSLFSILKYVYKRYPLYIKESKIKNTIPH